MIFARSLPCGSHKAKRTPQRRMTVSSPITIVGLEALITSKGYELIDDFGRTFLAAKRFDGWEVVLGEKSSILSWTHEYFRRSEAYASLSMIATPKVVIPIVGPKYVIFFCRGEKPGFWLKRYSRREGSGHSTPRAIQPDDQCLLADERHG